MFTIVLKLIGIALTESSDGLGQKYMTPEAAVGQNNTDIVIVGRAILNVSSHLCLDDSLSPLSH